MNLTTLIWHLKSHYATVSELSFSLSRTAGWGTQQGSKGQNQSLNSIVVARCSSSVTLAAALWVHVPVLFSCVPHKPQTWWQQTVETSPQSDDAAAATKPLTTCSFPASKRSTSYHSGLCPLPLRSAPCHNSQKYSKRHNFNYWKFLKTISNVQ